MPILNLSSIGGYRRMILGVWTLWITLLFIRYVDAGQAESAPADESCSATVQSPPFNPATVLEQILAEDYESMDPTVLPNSIVALKERGAHLCWHKHSTFLQHLISVHDILRLWGQGPVIGRLGLFHSAYSNSFVNLALFTVEEERPYMQSLIGEEAEDLVYLFCSIDRQKVVVETLLGQGYIPQQGLDVPHLRNSSQTIHLTPEILRLLMVFSMADVADQYFGWQDELFGGGGDSGSMLIPGQADDEQRHVPTALWPGVSKPGLWMSYLSQLGNVAQTFDPSWRTETSEGGVLGGPVIDFPPVFDNCTRVLTVEEETEAIDLYWEVVTSDASTSSLDSKDQISKLQQSTAKNPWVFEPHVLLSQEYLHQGEFALAEQEAQHALILQQQWGTPWDKRLSMGAWVAWTRVLLHRAQKKEPWPTNSFGIINLGLVEK